MIEIKHRFNESVLYRSESATTIREAVIKAVNAGANLSGAYLAGANLFGAYLARANLSGANLARADLGKQWIIQGSTRADGYAFFLQQLTADSAPMIKAGCRYFPVPAAIAHWLENRGGTPLGQESLLIVRHLVELARARGKITRETELELLSTWQSGEPQ